MDTKDFLSYLTFSEVKAAHRGRYTCKAENAAGSASYSEELVVHGSSISSKCLSMCIHAYKSQSLDI